MKILQLLLILSFIQLSLFAQGTLQDKTITHNDSLRSYKLFIPDTYDGSKEFGIVFNFHNVGENAELQIQVSRMNEVANERNFLIVYPQGLQIFNPLIQQFQTGWNEGSFTDLNDDVGFTFAIVEALATAYAIDRRHIHATGWGIGSGMTTRLLCDADDQIASGAAASNPFSDFSLPNCRPRRATSMLLMHGVADPLVPFGPAPENPVWAEGFQPTLDFWINNNNCPNPPTEQTLEDKNTEDASTVTLFNYQNCDSDTEVAFYQINGGGHAWPGGGSLPDFFGPVNQDINASEEMLNFFERNPLPSSVIPRGDTIHKTILMDDNTERSYILYVPSAYDGSADWPLVVNMHGFNLNSEHQIIYSAMNEVADTGQFLIAYPMGAPIQQNIRPNLPMVSPGWNSFADNDPSFDLHQNTDDLGFIERLLDEVSMEYSVDQDRIFATGFSMGGMMSTLLACELTDRIAAIAPVVGTYSRKQICTTPTGIPVMYILGTEDFISAYNGDADFYGADEMINLWLRKDRCILDPTMESLPNTVLEDSTVVEISKWQNCDNEILLYTVVNGGHQWHGGVNNLPILGHFNLDMNSSVEMWNFFKRNPKSKNKNQINAGEVFTSEGKTSVFICSGDGVSNVIYFQNNATKTDAKYTYIMTTDDNQVFGFLPGGAMEFEGSPPENCRMYGVAYTGNLLLKRDDHFLTATISDGDFDVSNNFVNLSIQRGNCSTADEGLVEYPSENNSTSDQSSFTNTTISTSQNRLPNEQLWTVFPNPTTSTLTVSFNKEDTHLGSLYLYNSLGQLVEERNKLPISWSNPVYLDMQNRKEGVYFLALVIGGQRVKIEKIILQPR